MPFRSSDIEWQVKLFSLYIVSWAATNGQKQWRLPFLYCTKLTSSIESTVVSVFQYTQNMVCTLRIDEQPSLGICLTPRVYCCWTHLLAKPITSHRRMFGCDSGTIIYLVT